MNRTVNSSWVKSDVRDFGNCTRDASGTAAMEEGQDSRELLAKLNVAVVSVVAVTAACVVMPQFACMSTYKH
ncbi:hypothetical protein E2C01_029573 [Portunus trituberculatus]|uniref:Uncharacterized protein n=1 Tax=Portunus trituberculatus TaxID=210409 RepID=A0A5B7ERT5_PORTR|nr:hypothetical protein [Portunus trituberculatus]